MSKTILTIFAGRENNLNILNKYLSKALDLKLLDEVHYWNYTRKNEDDLYVKSISNLKRTSSNVTESTTLNQNNFKFKTSNTKF